MIKERLNSLITEAMKEKDKVKTETFRAVKTAIMNWETSKEHAGQELKEADEIQLLKKLATQYEETAEGCNDGKHDELVADALRSAEIIREFLPAPVTKTDIVNAFNKVCEANGFELIKKNMGNIIKAIKVELPSADGKTVSQIVAENLH